MKILEFQLINDCGEDCSHENRAIDTFVELEYLEESAVYNATHTLYSHEEDKFWDYYLKNNLGITDEDVFYYFGKGESIPEIGEEWKVNSSIFRRIS